MRFSKVTTLVLSLIGVGILLELITYALKALFDIDVGAAGFLNWIILSPLIVSWVYVKKTKQLIPRELLKKTSTFYSLFIMLILLFTALYYFEKEYSERISLIGYSVIIVFLGIVIFFVSKLAVSKVLETTWEKKQ